MRLLLTLFKAFSPQLPPCGTMLALLPLLLTGTQLLATWRFFSVRMATCSSMSSWYISLPLIREHNSWKRDLCALSKLNFQPESVLFTSTVTNYYQKRKVVWSYIILNPHVVLFEKMGWKKKDQCVKVYHYASQIL